MDIPSSKFHTISFQHAFDGLKHTFQTQPNLRIHLGIALLVLLLGIVVHLSRLEWLIILFTIMWVLTAEMINTSLEAISDLVTSEFHQSVKIAKDVAAGMVLVGALGAIIVGVVIFWPHLISLIS